MSELSRRQRASQIHRLERERDDALARLTLLEAQAKTHAEDIARVREQRDNRPDISPEFAARYLGNRMGITSRVHRTDAEMERKLREHARKYFGARPGDTKTEGGRGHDREGGTE